MPEQNQPSPEVLAVRNHLVGHLGPPADVLQLSGEAARGTAIERFEIAVFAPAGGDAPVVLATCGISQAAFADGRRVEAVFIVRPMPDEKTFGAIQALLGSLAHHVASNGAPVSPGDVIEAPGPLAEISGHDSLLFLPPVMFVPTFHQATRPDGQIVKLLWMLPVHKAEADYALAHGAEKLLMLFAAQGLDLARLDRDEANTMLAPDDARRMAEERQKEVDKAGAEKPKPAAPPPARPTRGKPAEGVVDVTGFGDSGEIVLTRRTKDKPSKPKEAPAPPPEPPPPPAPPPRTAPGGIRVRSAAQPPPGAGPGGKQVIRFELPKAPPAAAPKPAAKPAAKPEPAAEAPKQESKEDKIAALKAAAKERARMKRGGGGEPDA